MSTPSSTTDAGTARARKPAFILGPIIAAVALIAAISPWGLGADAGPGGLPITARAFHDLNADGQWQLAEVEFTDFVVKAYDGAGNTATGVYDAASRSYSIATSGLEGTRFRVEFSGLKAPYFWGAAGTGTDASLKQSGTSVQFLDEGSEAVVSVTDPATYCQDNPFLVTTCFVAGNQLSDANSGSGTIHGVRYDWGSTVKNPGLTGTETIDTWQVDENGVPNDPTTAGLARHTGAVWGSAWDRNSGHLYVASFLKMFSGYGPEGPNAIYRVKVDPITGQPAGTPELFARVGNSTGYDPATKTMTKSFPATGGTEAVPVCNDLHGTDLTGPNVNPDVYANVYKCSFGDIDLSPDGRTLYAMSLKGREILEFSTATGNLVARRPVDLARIGVCPTDEANGAWPFALGINDGRVYVGGTCNGADAWGADAHFWVLSMGMADADWRLEFAHRTRRFRNDSSRWFGAYNSTDSRNPGFYQYWQRRIDATPAGANVNLGAGDVQVTDIEFFGRDLTLGMRGRSGDQIGTRIPIDGKFISTIGGGDLVCVWWDGAAYQIESGGSCGPNRAWQATIEGKAANSYPDGGPGRGDRDPDGVGDEFYWGDGANDVYRGTNDPQNKPYHDEPVFGGLSQVNSGPLAFTGLNPPDALGGELLFTGGIGWADSVNGSTYKGYLVYESEDPANMFENVFFGKSNGLGDLEALCAQAPIEIGNRVWIDDDADGIQDPEEAGVEGATVRLYGADGTLIATTTTDAEGRYVFSSAGPDGVVGTDDDLFGPGDEVVIRIDDPGDFAKGGPLYSHDPTLTDRTDGSAPTDDDQDSDGALGNRLGLDATPTRLDSASEVKVTVGVAGDNNHTYDFGFYELRYSLGNLVWLDMNNNGRVDDGEEGIDGVPVTLLADLDGDGEFTDVIATQQTTNGGYYLFTGLRAGDYRVAVQTPDGLTTSSGGDSEPAPDPDDDVDDDDNGTRDGARVISGIVTLGDEREPTGEPATPGFEDDTPDNRSNLTVDFGFHPTASLGNLVWHDVNNNGRVDDGEPGIDGITVDLFADFDGDGDFTDLVATQQTSNGGHYLFTGLDAGDYRVRITPIDGYRSSTGGNSEPAPDPDDDTTDNDDNGTTEGNAIWSAVVTLDAFSPTGEPATPGHPDTTPDNWSDTTVDFGLWRPVSLGNLVWIDANDNGVVDPGEAGVPDVPVRLYADLDGDGEFSDLVAETTTAADGTYHFENLVPGRYVVEFDLPDGYRSSTDVDTTANPDNDVDNDDNLPGTGTGTIRTNPVTLTPGGEPTGDGDEDGSSNLTVDAGIFRPQPSVSIDKFTNGCDARSATGEEGPTAPCPGDDGNNNPVVAVGSQVTWTYVVRNTGNVPLTNVVVTDDKVAADRIDCGDGSNRVAALPVGASTTCTATGTATEGQYTNLAKVDAEGEVTPGRDGGEPIPSDEDRSHYFGGQAGLTLQKYTNRTDTLSTGPVDDADVAGGPDNDANHVVAPGTTVHWKYVITNTGNTTVEGIALSDDQLGTVVCPATTLAPDASMTCAASGTLTEAGQYANIGTVTGVSTDGEPLSASDPSHAFVAVPGIAVEKLTNGEDADDAADAPALAVGSTVTWTYRVRNTGNVALSGITVNDDVEGEVTCPTTLLQPDDGAPGGPDEMTCTKSGVVKEGPYRNNATVSGTPSSPDGTPVPDIPVPTDEDPSHHTGLASAIGDRVWEDRNADGVQDEGEPGIPGVTVILRDADGNEVARTTTDEDGRYLFEGLAPGEYSIAVIPPEGWSFSPPGTTADDRDSDADPADGTMPSTILDPGERDLTWDAGLYRPVSLGNLVWLDADNDGRVDPGEAGIDGVTVRLFADRDGDGNFTDLVATRTTSDGGYYLFTGLAPGTYVVEVVTPIGHRTSTGGGSEPAPDPDNDVDNDDNGTAAGEVVRSLPVTLGDGEPTGEGPTPGHPDTTPDDRANYTVDFGFHRLVSLGNLVWEDSNDNGRVDEGERGVAGVVVNLYADLDGDGNFTDLVATTVTDADGRYLFENLNPGTYVVGVVIPEGYRSSSDVDTTGDPNNDVDNDDNLPGTGTGEQRTAPVTVTSGDEPTNDGDGADSNLTVDAGIFAPRPGVALKKYTNNCDAQEATGTTAPTAACPGDDGRNNPVVAVGDTVTWTYVVRNTGNVPLTNVVVTDDRVPAGDIDCGEGTNTVARIAVGGSATCAATGTATRGQYSNMGTVTADAEVAPGGPATPLSPAQDPSHYYGAAGSLTIKKFTNGVDADTLTERPTVPTGSTVTWTYVVTNTGDVPISDITVTDDREGDVACPSTTLAAGASMRCEKTGVATGGDYLNIGTASGVDPAGENQTSSDPSGYRGEDPELNLWIRKAAGPLGTDRVVNWTLLAGNDGPDAALPGAVIRDELPERVTYLSHIAPEGVTCVPADRVLECTVGEAWPEGRTYTVSVSTRVDDGVTGIVVNRASVSSPTPERTLDDNRAEASVEPPEVQGSRQLNPGPAPSRWYNPLAWTGGDQIVGLLGVLLLAGGAVFMMIARRRAREDSAIEQD